MINSEKMKQIRSIVIFCILVTVPAFLGPLLGGSPSKPGAGFVIWGMAPLLAAVIMRIATRSWFDAGFKLAIKRNAVWYIISIFIFPVMTVLTFLLGEILSVSSFTNFSPGPYLKTFLTAIPVFFVFSILEEFGWRGYLVPKLFSSGINSYLSTAIISVVWATWHIPYIKELAWVYSSENLVTFIPRFYLAMFAFAILYNEIRIITNSVWPAVIMHCIMNSFGHPLAADYIKVVPGYEYLVSSTGLFMILLIGLTGVILNRWRLRNKERQAHGPGAYEKQPSQA
ncbi:MAG TPA: type II CAAX endopeptidase family protein [Clostridia bacterium]|nr:type II CAAX endopeptidase family protein [Clostridia bacterium]